MNDISVFLIGIGVTLIASLLVVLVIRRHIRNVLVDLTGTEPRADFWSAFTSLQLFLVPLIVAMFFPPDGGGNVSVFFQVIVQVRWSFMGLAGTLLVYGLIIIRFVQTRPSRPPS